MTPVAWVLAFLSTYRATLLVTSDEITRPLREWLVKRVGQESRLGYLLTCPWCASVWVAVPVVVSGLLWSRRRTWQALTGALAASAVTGALASYASP